MNEIEQMISKWKARVAFLKEWISNLEKNAGNEYSTQWYKAHNKIYQLETEVESKEKFIDHYTKDIAMRESELKSKVKFVNDNMGSRIKQLRELKIEDSGHSEMRRGILERFKKKTYGSDNEKIIDFQNIQGLIKTYVNKDNAIQPA